MSDADHTSARRLRWAIRDSFLDYVDALEDATVRGTRDARGSFVFARATDAGEAASAGQGADARIARFTGTVEIHAHGGALSLVFEDPHVSHDGTRGLLSVRVPAAGRLDLATLGPLRSAEHGPDITDVALTLAGAELFAGHYRPYARMAALAFDLRASGPHLDA